MSSCLSRNRKLSVPSASGQSVFFDRVLMPPNRKKERTGDPIAIREKVKDPRDPGHDANARLLT